MRRKSALVSAGVPGPLLQGTPRDVRVNATGRLLLVTAAAAVVISAYLSARLNAAGDAWPALALPIASAVAAFVIFRTVRRQLYALAYGRPAMATVTRVEKKRTDKGTFWMVHYAWTTLSGATRVGRYQHGKKRPPAIGATIPVVYDRDDSARHARYPLPFVRIRT